MYTDVMIDLETTGTSPGSGILSIGAVAFNRGQPEKDWARFHECPISRRSCQAMHLLEDADTLAWWEKQGDDAKMLLYEASNPLTSTHIIVSLMKFGDWLPEKAKIWGNGADFDNILLGTAYEKLGLMKPWSYSNNRCFRTMKNEFYKVPKPEFQGVKHDALADALHQTRHLQAIFGSMRWNG